MEEVRETPQAEEVGEAPESGEGLSFEENMIKLETLVRQLERGELGLEDALRYYQEGVALVRLCQRALERTAQEVRVLTEKMER
jgi:exodeoxyribonuclease VII small subunit